jgi:NADH:ubiquinone oxidoreductase subunit 6 (subunit J)
MTDPTHSGPYAGPPAPQPGWPTPPPRPGVNPYTPARPSNPALLEQLSGALLILAALLAIGGSFVTLDKSVESVSGDKGGVVYSTVAKAWSYTSTNIGQPSQTVTQLYGIPLLIGSLLAIATAVLLLAGASRRLPLTRTLGVASAVLLFGTTLTVATSAVNDTQWDTEARSTTLGPGFYLITLACLLTLGATVLTLLGTQRPALPAQPTQPQPWPTAPAPAPQQHPAQPLQPPYQPPASAG